MAELASTSRMDLKRYECKGSNARAIAVTRWRPAARLRKKFIASVL